MIPVGTLVTMALCALAGIAGQLDTILAAVPDESRAQVETQFAKKL